MFKIDRNYTEYYDPNDPAYPGGKAVAASTPESMDGTNWRASLFNDIHGAKQALYIEAFGSLDGITGRPDTAFDSDFVRAILRLIRRHSGVNQVHFSWNIKAKETFIPLSEIDIFFNPEEEYAVTVVLNGESEYEYRFTTNFSKSGLRIITEKLVDGEIMPEVEAKRWGDGGKWGDGRTWGKHGGLGNISVNILIRGV